MKIFNEKDLRDYLEDRRQRMLEEIEEEDKNKLLNVNEIEYVMYLVKKYSVDPLDLHYDRLTQSSREETVSTEGLSARERVSLGSRSTRQVITLHLPFSGDQELLSCKPPSWMQWTPEVTVTGDEVRFDIVNWDDDAKVVKGKIQQVLNKIRPRAEDVKGIVNEYNASLESFAQEAVRVRKGVLLQQAKLVEALDIPLRKSGDIPSTFAVPIAPKRLIIKPEAPDSKYVPEPTLDRQTYSEILKIISETGIAMERTPSVYRDKDEPALRDQFLMVLSTHFSSATGETFNKSGKTDILIRHENRNVFVAECKFWDGIKTHFGAIDQILGYLTWRESKAAILCFVRNNELQPVLDQIESKTSDHDCFMKYHGKQSESWFNFELHLKDDPTRSVHLAVLCFHFPET